MPEAGGDARWLLRRGPVATLQGEADWPATWTAISGPLRICVGDLLADRPAGDPAGVRALQRDSRGWQWVVELGGTNPCGLQGRLLVDAEVDRADAAQLRCGDRPWHEGGRQEALARVRGLLRGEALARWPELDPEERALWLDVLEEDPEAAVLVEELRGPAAP